MTKEEKKEEKPAEKVESPKSEVGSEEKEEKPQADEKGKEPEVKEEAKAVETKEEKPEEKKAEEEPAEEVKEEKPAEKPKVEEAKPAEKAKPAEAPKAEEPKVAVPAGRQELSKEAKQIVDTLKNMSVLELSKLVKELESVFGVSAAAPVAAVGGAPAAGAPAAEAGEEKTVFDVVLSAAGDKKIQVIKEVRTITGLGLKEAKALVDSAPKPVKQGVNKEEAGKIKAQLEGAGATVEVK